MYLKYETTQWQSARVFNVNHLGKVEQNITEPCNIF